MVYIILFIVKSKSILRGAYISMNIGLFCSVYHEIVTLHRVSCNFIWGVIEADVYDIAGGPSSGPLVDATKWYTLGLVKLKYSLHYVLYTS